MAQKMLSYIKEQPEVWKNILNNRNEIFSPMKALSEKKIKRIVIIGSGSSYNAGDMAASFFTEQLGIESYAIVPTRISKLPELLCPDETIIFAASQTGRSTSTLGAVKKFKENGFETVAVTAVEDCPLVRECDYYQPIVCGEETVGPKTKGQTATILTLYIAVMTLCLSNGMLNESKSNEIFENLKRSFEFAEGNILKSCEFVKQHCSMLAEKESFTLIADGVGYPAIKEGALKILETLCVPAVAYEFEEYLHGVNHTIAEGRCNLVVPGLSENIDRMNIMNEYCIEKGCDNLVITSVPWNDGENVLKLNGSGSDYTIPFEALIFFQIVSVFGSEAKGIECDLPRNIDFYQKLDTKAQDAGSNVWKG